MMYATYSVEDNKLRLYSTARLSVDDYAAVKAAGFAWAPKQELFVAPAWTPAREDLLLDMCDEIGDEDYSPEERAADRAERFGDYRDRRAAEAGGSSDRFGSGPSAFGHQSMARAERQAARHDRHRTRAVSQWSKAEYWQTRTEGVIRHALYKSSAAVRRSRILRLEAEQRKHDKERAEYATWYAAWSKVPTLDGAGTVGVYVRDGYRLEWTAESVTPALRLAYALANSSGCHGYFTHPRTGMKDQSLYSLLTDPQDPLTPGECAALWLDGKRAPDDPDSTGARWSAHYENRLTYERAMLAAEGGAAWDADMVPGGWVKGRQIYAVNRSPVTKRVVSVKIMGMVGGNWHGEGAKPGLVTVNVERMAEGDYRAPTAEELEAFNAAQKAAREEKKAKAPKKPPLINPTDEDANRLQDIWAAHDLEEFRRHNPYCSAPPLRTVRRMTQAEYSAASKGAYARAHTVEVKENLRADGKGRTTVFEIRVFRDSVVILTDKPQKPIPWDAVTAAAEEQPTEESLADRLDDIGRILAASFLDHLPEDDRQLFDDAQYVGWVWSSSVTQKGWTDKGRAALAKYRTEVVNV